MNLDKIIKIDFPDNQFIKTKTDKNQIILHHTVSPEGIKADVNWWIKDERRIATHLIIDHKGVAYQLFDFEYYAYHIGVRGRSYLDKFSIGIELDSLGGLVKNKLGQWFDVYNRSVNPRNVIEYKNGFRGFYAFEKYTYAQIETLKSLLLYLCDRYKIPLDYDPEMWDINKRALAGTKGIFTHVSYRNDKSDCHPYYKLIEMLKSLKNT